MLGFDDCFKFFAGGQQGAKKPRQCNILSHLTMALIF